MGLRYTKKRGKKRGEKEIAFQKNFRFSALLRAYFAGRYTPSQGVASPEENHYTAIAYLFSKESLRSLSRQLSSTPIKTSIPPSGSTGKIN